MNNNININQILETKKIIICTGSGGVGKTTVSAVLAIRGAELGKKVLVLTIDPAKRLADSLGIGDLTGGIKEVPLKKNTKGKLFATMLDIKRSMDKIIKEFAKTEEQADTILANSIYKQFSSEFGGGIEYGAMGQLYQINKKNEYDLIILDTPPSQHAIDFINAPKKLSDFFNRSVLKYFLPEKSNSIIGATSQLAGKQGLFILKIFQKLTGSHFIDNMHTFFKNFQGMYEAFKLQSDKVSELLKDESTAFLIILGPGKKQVDESILLYDKFIEMELHFNGYIINKCLPDFFDRIDDTMNYTGDDRNNIVDYYSDVKEYEDYIVNKLEDESVGEYFIKKMEAFPHDVYSVEILLNMAKNLSD